MISEAEIQRTFVLDENSKEQFKTIESKIKSERLFQNPNLNLRVLAANLDVKEKELSKLINQCSETNFYQFINRFRVDEFKNLMQSPKARQMSILGLAQEAGFSSKSTFYSAFKTIEGVTPKQYELSLNKSG
ncbi:AraC family transcriptional regulator [Aquimarina sp. AU474]|uniref:helix-turn-helix domain-containing protein n=1 Tax=Aquimarina sp. AU474 TaxID=2108529 RepID=UPI000D68B8B2|nr:helix-turn-helix domain-containing protein [Aquimarina sp. AU474]